TALLSSAMASIVAPIAQTSTAASNNRFLFMANAFHKESWRGSVAVDIDHRLGKSLRGLLRQIVPDARCEVPVRILAREFRRVSTGLDVERAIGVALHRDRGHSDDRACRKALFQIVIFPLAVDQPESPAVVVDHDSDMIRVVESRRAAIVRGVVEHATPRSLR